MSFKLRIKHSYQAGLSLVELMVGLTIGFIVLAVIVQTMSVFEEHKKHTTATSDAQVNGLTALMQIETDIRRAASGFNHPATFSCQNLYSYYQAVSGTGAASAVSSFVPFPVEIVDGGSGAPDTITVRQGGRFSGAAPTWLTQDMVIDSVSSPPSIKLTVERAYDFVGAPVAASDPPADLVMVTRTNEAVTGTKTSPHCSLMQVSSVDLTTGTLTIANGPSGKTPEYNAPHAYMTTNNWPGFGTNSSQGYKVQDYVFRVGSTSVGGVYSVSYSLDADKNLQSVVSGSGTATASTEVLASEIVALQAQYGVSSSKNNKTISAWVDPTGATWGAAALKSANSTAADNRQRIKAIRIAVVARSSQRDSNIVTSACTDNNATNYGPCSWLDDTSANPAPVIDLRSAPGDTEWQHYRYKVYQTVIPMRNVLWPSL